MKKSYSLLSLPAPGYVGPLSRVCESKMTSVSVPTCCMGFVFCCIFSAHALFSSFSCSENIVAFQRTLSTWNAFRHIFLCFFFSTSKFIKHAVPFSAVSKLPLFFSFFLLFFELPHTQLLHAYLITLHSLTSSSLFVCILLR